jgi:toxin ParE1/3/4
VVRWTAHATTQLRHIHDYMAQDSPLYAKRVVGCLGAQDLPARRIAPYGTQSAGTRRRRSTGAVVVLNRILYEIKTTHIDIFAVIHKRRDLLAEEIPREL